MGIFAQTIIGRAAGLGEEKIVVIDATYIKAHRTAFSLAVKRGAWAPDPLPGKVSSSDARKGVG